MNRTIGGLAMTLC